MPVSPSIHLKPGSKVQIKSGNYANTEGTLMKVNVNDQTYRVQRTGGQTVWCNAVSPIADKVVAQPVASKPSVNKSIIMPKSVLKVTTVSVEKPPDAGIRKSIAQKPPDAGVRKSIALRTARSKSELEPYESDCDSDASEIWDSYAHHRPKGVTEGAKVTIVTGPNEGKTGQILKVDDDAVRKQRENAAVRYRVQMDGGGITWVTKVKVASAAGSRKSITVVKKSTIDQKKLEEYLSSA